MGMSPHVVSGDSFGQVVERAREACASGPVMNLTLHVSASFPLLSDHFLESYLQQARLWQQHERPASMYINHGEFMNRYCDAVDYLVDQLKSRPTGNRACVVLVGMQDLYASGDEPRPSFILVQAGFDTSSREHLYLTAYYRALEVSGFLPINLAEMALIATEVQRKIIDIAELDLTIHSFRSYSSPGFSRLTKARIDTLSAAELEKLVEDRAVEEVKNLVREKMQPDSVVELSGLAILQTALQASGWCEQDVLTSIDKAISTLTQLKEARGVGSHATVITRLQALAVRYLREALDQLKVR